MIAIAQQGVGLFEIAYQPQPIWTQMFWPIVRKAVWKLAFQFLLALWISLLREQFVHAELYEVFVLTLW